MSGRTSECKAKDKVYQTLIVTDDNFATGELLGVLQQAGCEIVSEVRLAALASSLEKWHPELVAIQITKPTTDALTALSDLKAYPDSTVVMFTGDNSRESIELAVDAGVDAYLTELPTLPRLRTVIDVADARSKFNQSLNLELANTKSLLRERKIIERAKGILMQRKSLDEASAYRAMQKMAMDRNVKLVELSQSMLSAAEILD